MMNWVFLEHCCKLQILCFASSQIELDLRTSGHPVQDRLRHHKHGGEVRPSGRRMQLENLHQEELGRKISRAQRLPPQDARDLIQFQAWKCQVSFVERSSSMECTHQPPPPQKELIKQSDQIGRIFAYCAIVFLGQFLKY
jgi:hypothetical protein